MGTVFIDSNREVFFLENAIEKKIYCEMEMNSFKISQAISKS